MQSIRRLVLTGGLVLALLLVGAPFQAVVAVEAAPGVVTAHLDVTDTALQSTVQGQRTEVVEAPIAFTGLWVELDTEVAQIEVRTSADAETWSDWAPLDTLDEDDGPDPASDEGDAAISAAQLRRTSGLLLTDESHYVQVQVPDEVGGFKVHFAEASGANDSFWTRAGRWLSRTATQPAAASGVPEWVIGRDQWGANEAATGSIRTADEVELVVVHHTASSSTYTRDQVPNQLRIIQNYHIGQLGWDDIGYNAVVDRFGRVYEGRKGGLHRGVIGAHASNFNTGSFGVAVLGNFTNDRAPQAAVDALADIISYKSVLHGFDPEGVVEFRGKERPVVVGHRDVGNTVCPGKIQEQLGDITVLANLRAAGFGPFGDINENNTHGPQVLRLYEDGIINGCRPGQFCPADKLTRAQAAALLSRALELAPGDGSVFLDVRAGSTHERDIGAAVAANIITGYVDGRFGPGDPLTREQMASLLARALRLETVVGAHFKDVTFTTPPHGANVYAIAGSGITRGCHRGPEFFCPSDHITRAQMASFVDAMLVYLGRYEPLPSGDAPKLLREDPPPTQQDPPDSAAQM